MTTTIQASQGEPYRVSRSGAVITLSRMVAGRPVRIMFGAEDALRVADALVDAVEVSR